MNNLIASVIRFFKNKNTVTILGVIATLGLLYWGYKTQIDKAVAPVSIPVAMVEIQPRTEITADMIKTIEVPSIAVDEGVYLSQASIIGKVANINSVIPAGSMFYKGVLIEKKDLPDAAFVDVKEGEIPYQFPVDMDSTFGNSIFPGNKIDIYMKANDDNGQIMIGKLLENVEVLSVKDSDGNNVFENTLEKRTPAVLIFGLPEKIHIMIRKASYMGNYSVELIPVPHGGAIETEGEMQVSSQYLEAFIDSHTVTLPENEVIEETEDGTENDDHAHPSDGE